ncbi:MAG: hypothetical protein QM730_13915 [Anaerolineales bacterium]
MALAVKTAIKEKINQMEAEQRFLTEEKTRLEKELSELEIDPDIENRITEIAADVRERLPNATFQGMRDLLELLNVKVSYFHSNKGVKLRVSCEIPGSEGDIMVEFLLNVSSSCVKQYSQYVVIIHLVVVLVVP